MIHNSGFKQLPYGFDKLSLTIIEWFGLEGTVKIT